MSVATCILSSQLQFKKDILIQALKKHTNFNTDKMKIRETIGMENPFRYRNKSQFQAEGIKTAPLKQAFLAPIPTNLCQQMIASYKTSEPFKSRIQYAIYLINTVFRRMMRHLVKVSSAPLWFG